jgi:hypothetical protein
MIIVAVEQQKWQEFRKRFYKRKLCVLIFSTTSVSNISHYRDWFRERCCDKCASVLMPIARCACHILIKLEFSKNTQMSAPPVIACEQTNMTKRAISTSLYVAYWIQRTVMLQHNRHTYWCIFPHFGSGLKNPSPQKSVSHWYCKRFTTALSQVLLQRPRQIRRRLLPLLQVLPHIEK